MNRSLPCTSVLTLVLTGSGLQMTPPGPPASSDVRRVIHAKASAFSGTILVARRGKRILHESFGLANREFAVRNTTATRYPIASITKLFTAVLVLQLHDEGKLALDEPIVRYLPACAGALGASATVHQLLNHTSGMKDIVAIRSKEEAVRNGIDLYQRPYAIPDILLKYCTAPPQAPAGTAFAYNNGDYLALGLIVEAIEKQPFEQVLTRRILVPLGLRGTGMTYQHRIVPRLAHTYFTRDDRTGELSKDLPVYVENWYSAGAMYSTPQDLEMFADALFRGTLLKPKTLALLVHPGADKYGYGVWIFDDTIGGRRYTSVMRPGQIMGINVVLYRVLEEDLTIVILGNTDKVNVDALAHAIAERLLQ